MCEYLGDGGGVLIQCSVYECSRYGTHHSMLPIMSKWTLDSASKLPFVCKVFGAECMAHIPETVACAHTVSHAHSYLHLLLHSYGVICTH